jgi:hypothetical protein
MLLTLLGLWAMSTGIHRLIFASRFRMTLHLDRIEVRGISEERTIARSEISEWRIDTQSPSSIVLVPEEDGADEFKIARLCAPDEALREWLEGLLNPDLEREEQEKREVDKVFEDTEFGATRDQRTASFASARKRARALNWITLGVCAWTLFDPEHLPFTFSALMALPWFAVVLAGASNGLIKIGAML